MRNVGFRSARTTAAIDGGSPGAGSMRSAHAPSTSDDAASTEKTTLRPTSAAAAPTTGPNIAPNVAEPIAVPIICPRRSRGTTASNQANAPAHVKPLPPPWRRRAAKSVQKPPAKAKPRLASPTSVSPMSTARRAPSRVAVIPPAIPATSAPHA